MPRVKRRQIEAFPRLTTGREYLVLVVESRIQKDALHLRLRHLRSEQDGNEQTFSLAFPIRPAGPLASLAAALEANLNEPSGVDERLFTEAVGKLLRVTFLVLPDGSVLIDQFMPTKESSDADNASEA